MRADAARNAAKLREAATTLFRQRGLGVPLKEIARCAEVSHGTIYNLYGSREALINEVVAELAASRLEALGSEALAHEDAWEGFCFYVTEACAVQASEPAVGDVISGRYPEAAGLMKLCDGARRAADEVLQRAHSTGQLRTDFTGKDLAVTFGTLSHLARSSEVVAPGFWRRSVRFMLDGLRAENATQPLLSQDIDDPAVYAVLGSLSGGATK